MYWWLFTFETSNKMAEALNPHSSVAGVRLHLAQNERRFESLEALEDALRRMSSDDMALAIVVAVQEKKFSARKLLSVLKERRERL